MGVDRDLALVAAASQGPVPQLLWMMTSILVEVARPVNAAPPTGRTAAYRPFPDTP